MKQQSLVAAMKPPARFRQLLPCIGLCWCVLMASASDVRAEPLPALMARAEEMDLALSAAPEHLRANAAVYVLARGGYTREREGGNGFSCIVEREDDGTIAPICFDREGAETTLRAVLRRTQLREQGESAEAADRTIAEEYRARQLVAPRKPGVAYMLSSRFEGPSRETGAVEQVYPPHVMFYAPYYSNADIGALPAHRGSTTQPWILNEGQPDAYIIVVPHEH